MGDFVKGPISADFPEELARHLLLHRQIDTFTTRSTAFQCSRQRLNPGFRYARGILVDVFYDHFLAGEWENHSGTPLADFAQQVYRGLEECYQFLPAALQTQLPRMIEHDWLTSYQYPDVVLRVLQRLEARLKNRFPLAQGIVDLENNRSELQEDFRLFMQEIKSTLDC